MISDKIQPQHLARKALLYVRQSSPHQVLHNKESSTLQYAMRGRLTALGWSEIEVIDDDLGRSAALTSLNIANDGAPVALVFDPEIPLGSSHVAASCNGRTIAASLERNAQDEHARLELTVPHGKTHCDLRYQGGVDVIPDIPRPQVGDTSIGLKIIGLSLEQNVLTVTADADLGKQTSFTLRTAAIPELLGGARLEVVPDGSYRVILDSSSSPVPGYVRRTVRLHLVQTGSEHRVLSKR